MLNFERVATCDCLFLSFHCAPLTRGAPGFCKCLLASAFSVTSKFSSLSLSSFVVCFSSVIVLEALLDFLWFVDRCLVLEAQTGVSSPDGVL